MVVPILRMGVSRDVCFMHVLCSLLAVRPGTDSDCCKHICFARELLKSCIVVRGASLECHLLQKQTFPSS